VFVPHPLTTDRELDAAIARSFERPIVIFKHSVTCGTSAYAHEEILDLLGGPLPVDVYLVNVHSHRATSNAVASRFGLRHESPQVLLIRDGALVWHASHHRVTSDEIAAALERS
jgi:bacillithiol system protein YtxJ